MGDDALVPVLTLDVDDSHDGPTSIADRVTEFARSHGVEEQVRTPLGAAVADVAGLLPGSKHVDADVTERDVQVVITHAAGDRLPALRPRLAEIGARCDGFAVERVGAELEVWLCQRR
jgi:hypothetical protein